MLLYDASGKAWQQDVPLAPRQTVRFVVSDLVKAAGLSGSYGGLRFETAHRAGYIDTFYFLYDETAGFSATMKMFDHNPTTELQERLFAGNTVWTTWAPMLPLQNPDPALALPAGTQLQPKVFLRNTTPQPQSTNVKLTWRGEAKTGALALPRIELQPFQTYLVDVQLLQQTQQIPPDAHWALVEISSPTAKPDDLMAVASSYDRTGRFGAQTPFSDQLADHWAGGEWQVDAAHNSIIAVTNVGKKPAEALLTFHYNHGQDQYEVQKTIAAGDQLWLNLGDLIHGAVPDRQGRTFPADLTYGTYDIRQPHAAGNPSLFEGKIIVDKTYGHLAYGCVMCCGFANPQILANPEYLAVLGQDALGVWATDQCQDDQVDVSDNFSGWDTNNHSVAVMSSRQITGMGAGSTNAFASGTLNFGSEGSNKCLQRHYTPQNNNNVQVPTASRIQTVQLNFALTSGAGCPTGQNGWYRQMLKLVTDQNGLDIVLGDQSLSETVNVGRNDLNLLPPQTGTATTNSSGLFQDYFFFCSAYCPGGGETDATQTINDTLPSGAGPFHVTPNSLVYKCTGITVNGQ